MEQTLTLSEAPDAGEAAVAPTRDRDALAAGLVEALRAPANAAEMAALIADICTPAEAASLAERWHVARLLDQGRLTYREIHDATGVSTTTIVRVARFLRQAPHHGYRRAIDRLSGRLASSGETRRVG
jgi:TrpR-related protein YerC/YecD